MSPAWFGGQAFRWTEEEGMVGLEFLDGMTEPPGGFGSWSWDMSDDGEVIVGYSPNSTWAHGEAFRWTEELGMVGLGHLPGRGGDPFSEAVGANRDGTVITGRSYNGIDEAG